MLSCSAANRVALPQAASPAAASRKPPLITIAGSVPRLHVHDAHRSGPTSGTPPSGGTRCPHRQGHGMTGGSAAASYSGAGAPPHPLAKRERLTQWHEGMGAARCNDRGAARRVEAQLTKHSWPRSYAFRLPEGEGPSPSCTRSVRSCSETRLATEAPYEPISERSSSKSLPLMNRG